MGQGNTGMRVNTANIAADFDIVTLTLPANNVDGKDLRTLIQESMDLAVGGVPDWWDKIVTWEIVENAAAILVSKKEDMSTPNFVIDATRGFAPPVGRPALTGTHLRTHGAAGTSKAMLLVYLMDQPTSWNTEVDPLT